MRVRVTAILLALALVAAAVALAGCDQIIGNAVKGAVQQGTGVKIDKNGNQVTVQGSNGESVTVGGSQGTLSEGFPTEFPQYTGATLKSSAKVSTPAGTVYTAEWTTADSPDVVMKDLRDQAQGRGVHDHQPGVGQQQRPGQRCDHLQERHPGGRGHRLVGERLDQDRDGHHRQAVASPPSAPLPRRARRRKGRPRAALSGVSRGRSGSAVTCCASDPARPWRPRAPRRPRPGRNTARNGAEVG